MSCGCCARTTAMTAMSPVSAAANQARRCATSCSGGSSGDVTGVASCGFMPAAGKGLVIDLLVVTVSSRVTRRAQLDQWRVIATCRPRRAFASDHPRATDCAVGRVCGGRNLSVATGKVEEEHVRLVPPSFSLFYARKGWKSISKRAVGGSAWSVWKNGTRVKMDGWQNIKGYLFLLPVMSNRRGKLLR